MTRKPRTICAFTLVEMLVVVTVIALMLGIGVGAYISFNRDMTWHASVTTISSLLQACRNSASSDQTPAVLVIDTEPAPDEQGMFICKQVYAATLERVATWHFESLASTGGGATVDGSFGQKAAMNGDAALVEGRYGKAIRFVRWDDGSSPVSSDSLTCDNAPAYDIREGLRLSAWVRPELPPDGLAQPAPHELFYPIVAKPESLNADMEQLDQQPVYSLSLMRLEGERSFRLLAGVRLGDALLETMSEAVIRPDVWAHVAMTYSSVAPSAVVRVFIDGKELHEIEQMINRVSSGSPPVDRRIKTSELPLQIGGLGGTDLFHGAIDEVLIDSLQTSERRTLSPNVYLQFFNCNAGADGTQFRVEFDTSGQVVPAADGLPLIALCSPGSPIATLIGVERTGTVRTWNATWERDPAKRGIYNAEIDRWQTGR